MPRHARRILLPALILGLIAGWRLLQARTLVMPAWVDSVNHALVVRILLEQRRIPLTWEPYLPEVPFYYHFGFHLTASVVATVLGANPGRAVLLAGHLWQVALAAGVYLLASRLSRDHRKALSALLLVGFVSQMPAYYVTWGRYTLLAGLALAVFAMSAALAGHTVTLLFLVAATAITHYYALFLLLLFLALMALLDGKQRKNVMTGGFLGLALASPWLLRVLKYGYSALGVRVLTSDSSYNPGYLVYLLGPMRNIILLGLGLAGAITWVSHRDKEPSRSVFVIWSAVIMVMLSPWCLGPFRPDHAAIVLFLPAVILAPEVLWHLPRPAMTGVCLALLMTWGLWQTHNIIKPETALATSDDMTAISWAAKNTPVDAIFLVDATEWFGIWRGVDGGWWLEPLAGRRTIPPPAAYAWAKRSGESDIDRFSRRISLLRELPDHLYCRELALIGDQTRATYYYTRSDRPRRCPGFRMVYQGTGGPLIFTLKPP